MTHSGCIRRRLLAGFGVLVLTISSVSALTLAGVARVHAAQEVTKHEEEGMRRALELAAAVRDEYAHQAHTIIIGDESHLSRYEAAHRLVHERTEALRSFARGPEECGWMDDIEDSSEQLDSMFRERIVPAVVRGDRAFVRSEHGRAQEVVTAIQERTEWLVDRFQRRIDSARADVSDVERRTNRSIVAFLVGSPLLSVLIAYALGRSITTPLAKLSEGANRLARGDLDTKLEVRSNDELGALALQFNAMTDALKQHQRKLMRSERVATTGHLAASVAHQIQAPLTTILDRASRLSGCAASSDDDHASVIHREAVRCTAIVDGLLDLSRACQAGSDRVDLRELSKSVVAQLEEIGVLDGIDVSIEGDTVAQAHEANTRQVIHDLVRNAAEASRPGGRVVIALWSLGDESHLVVRDSGTGVSDEVRPHLFEPFFTTKPAATGLGLAVSRAIARAHGGDIQLSPGEGPGASFALTLPRH